MTTSLTLPLLATLGLVACTHAPVDTFPHSYRCEGRPIQVTEAAVIAGETTARLAERDSDQDRYTTVTDDPTMRIEYAVPHDRFADARVARYRAGDPTPRWSATCIADAGYTDSLERYLHSQSSHAVATELQLPDDEARARIWQGWVRVGTRFRRDHP